MPPTLDAGLHIQSQQTFLRLADRIPDVHGTLTGPSHTPTAAMGLEAAVLDQWIEALVDLAATKAQDDRQLCSRDTAQVGNERQELPIARHATKARQLLRIKIQFGVGQ